MPSSSQESTLAALREVISLVRDLPPTPPALRLFQVTRGKASPSDGKASLPDVTAADLTLRGNTLALACEDSSVQLFPVRVAVAVARHEFCYRRLRIVA